MSADDRDMDRLAEEVAQGRSLATAARRIGVSIHRARFLWARIIARLGPQANEGAS